MLAALLSLAWPAFLAARQAEKARETRTERKRVAPAVKKHANSKTHKGKVATWIHQNSTGEVVLDRVEMAHPVLYGPFLPPEPQNYPQPLCEALDAVVVEVRLHEPDADAPEVETGELTHEASQNGEDSKPGLARIARQLGSLLRPKSSAASVQPEDVDLAELLSQSFLIPVEGVDAEKLRDSFLSGRGRHKKHLAIDIGAPKGTSVLATTDGDIVRISRERRGGKAIYQKDSTGQYLLFYCHLSGYAQGLEVGQRVAKGDVIGYVGRTGHVVGGSHLHFSIIRMPEDNDNFKAGLAVNPYLLFLAGVP